MMLFKHYENELRRFQRAAIDFIREVKRCALFIDMGLGKTIISLSAIMQLVQELGIKRALVFGPPRVVNKVWTDEIKDWEHVNTLTATIIKGTSKARFKKLQSATDIHLISMDLVDWLAQSDHDLSMYDAIFWDESSGLKSNKTNRWKAAKFLVLPKERVEYFVQMTGTPATEGLHQLWSQLYLLDGGERLMASITAFRQRWFDSNHDGTGYRIKGAWAEKAIRDRIQDICFTLRENDYSELPPRIDNVIEVELPPERLKEYKKFERTYVLQVTDTEKLTSVSAAGLGTKLLQLANGVVYLAADEEGNRKEIFFHDEKLNALQTIVEEAQGEPVLVSYAFRTDIKAIQSRFPHAVLLGNNARTIDEWNAGQIPMMLVHHKSAGHGLNLQFGGSIAVWYGLTHSLEGYQQLNKRLHRKGQTRTTVIHHLIAKGTVDEAVLKGLRKKDAQQEALLNSLKRYIEDVEHAA
jgi:SNF2 family DNA or RNA helicase